MTLFENIGFVVINFILFIAFAYIICYTTQRGDSTNKIFVYSIASIVYTLLLLSIKISMCSNKDNKNSKDNFRPNVNMSKDMFTFEVTPSKKCCNNYLAGPECAKFYNTPEGISELHSTCCGGGFSGRPVQYEFTPESDQNWEDKRCNPKPTGFWPAVL
jgi:hypothetical protein